MVVQLKLKGDNSETKSKKLWGQLSLPRPNPRTLVIKKQQ